MEKRDLFRKIPGGECRSEDMSKGKKMADGSGRCAADFALAQRRSACLGGAEGGADSVHILSAAHRRNLEVDHER